MLDSVVAASFEYVQESDQIALQIRVRVGYRIAHPCLSGQIDHFVEVLL